MVHEGLANRKPGATESQRVEEIWGGEFGNDYVKRNLAAANGRGPFWKEILTEFPVESVLEVGCNIGANLRWIVEHIPPRLVCGVDINEFALRGLRQALPDVNAMWSPARGLPFRDQMFDLVFTTGVLIHQPPDVLPQVMREIVRCSRRYVLAGEYFSATPAEIVYRGQTGLAWKRDFGRYYQELFPELRLRRTGFLAKKDGGWDDVTYWMFEKARQDSKA